MNMLTTNFSPLHQSRSVPAPPRRSPAPASPARSLLHVPAIEVGVEQPVAARLRDDARGGLSCPIFADNWRLWPTLHGSTTTPAAFIAADTDVPAVLAASVAAIPPLVLLSITHLTVILTRPTTTPDADVIEEVPAETVVPSQAVAAPEVEQAQPVELPVVSVSERRVEAAQLREVEGWSNKQIARHLGVHPSTVGRWFTPAINGAKEETS